MNSDLALLHRYHRDADASAFAELMRLHAGMVFSTALRVTRDAALAEDVAQEAFLTLVRNSHRTIDSVAAWLHHVTRQRACDAVRRKITRQRYEPAAERWHEAADEAGWAEIEPVVDEVLEELPERHRTLLIEHFLEQRTQQELARQLGMSQSTVSRHLEEALQGLRDALRRKGIVCGLGLGGLLIANSAQAAPATLTASVSKIAMTGIGSAAAASAASTSFALIAMTAPFKVLVAVGVVAGIAFPFLRHHDPPATVPAKAASASRPPAPPIPAPPKPAPAKTNPASVANRKGSTMTSILTGSQMPEEDKRLILAEFKRLGGVIKEEYVDKDMDQIIQNYYKGDRAAFEYDLTQQGHSFESYKDLRRDMMIISVLRARAAQGITDPAAKQRAIDDWLNGLRTKSFEGDLEKLGVK